MRASNPRPSERCTVGGGSPTWDPQPQMHSARTPSGDIQPAQHHGAVLGTLLWMQVDREQSHFTGCQGAVGEGPKLPGVGSWSWKVALPQRDAWGQPGEGAQGFPPGRQRKGLGGGERSLGGGGRDQHTDRERWRGLGSLRRPGPRRAHQGPCRARRLVRQCTGVRGFQTEPGPGVGGGASASGRGWGPDRTCFPALSGPGQWL